MSKRWVSRNLGLFSGADQTENFRSLASIFPCRVARRSERPHRWPETKPLRIPSRYEYESERRNTAALLADTETPDSDVRASGRALAAGDSRTEIAAGLQREFEAGTYHRYNSIDTHVLSLVSRRATQRTPTDYLREKL